MGSHYHSIYIVMLSAPLQPFLSLRVLARTHTLSVLYKVNRLQSCLIDGHPMTYVLICTVGCRQQSQHNSQSLEFRNFVKRAACSMRHRLRPLGASN